MKENIGLLLAGAGLGAAVAIIFCMILWRYFPDVTPTPKKDEPDGD